MASSRYEKQYPEGPGRSRSQGKYSSDKDYNVLKYFFFLELVVRGVPLIMFRRCPFSLFDSAIAWYRRRCFANKGAPGAADQRVAE